jgi:hypothetical protein
MCDTEDKSTIDADIDLPIDILKQDKHTHKDKVTHLCEGNTYGYCSNEPLITKEVVLNYRTPKWHFAPKVINVNFCRKHYEWIKQKNNGLFPINIYGYDKSEAIDETLCEHFRDWNYDTKISNIYTFYYNVNTRKVILLNHDPNFKLSYEWEKKGSFHYNGYDNINYSNIVELTPISWEIIIFYEQKKTNKTYKLIRFVKSDNDSASNSVSSSSSVSSDADIVASESSENSENSDNDLITCKTSENSANSENSDNDVFASKSNIVYLTSKYITIENNSVLDKWIEDRSIFEECLDFIKQHMNIKLNYFETETETEENQDIEKSYLFQNSIRLENALLNKNPDSTLDLLNMIEQDVITLDILWIIYIKYNHRLHSPEFSYEIDTCYKSINETYGGDSNVNSGGNGKSSTLMKYNPMLISLFIKICNKEELKYFLTVAIEGCRNEITYRMNDFYDYIHPNLYVVKRIVPEHISKWENILPIPELIKDKPIKNTDISISKDDSKDDSESVNENIVESASETSSEDIMMTPLEYWHNYKNYTWSFDGKEHIYEYDKDNTIRDYLA